MANLISKDDDLMKSAPVIGFELLKLIRASDDSRVSIFDIARKLRKSNKVSARSIYYGMIFLYSLDIVDFNEPYLIRNVEN